MEIGLSYGIIRNVDLDHSDEDILKLVTCTEKVISAKRLNRRDKGDGRWCPSEVARLSFKCSKLPPFVYVDGLRIKVEPYVHPVTQCFKCWKIGHSIGNCTSKVFVCPKCGGDHPNCVTTTFKCVNCRGNHISMAKTCPVYQKERKLRELMSEFNCTYRKALTLYAAPLPRPLEEEIPCTNSQSFPPLKHSPQPVSDKSPCFASYSNVLSEGRDKSILTRNVQDPVPGTSKLGLSDKKIKIQIKNEKREKTAVDPPKMENIEFNTQSDNESLENEDGNDRKTTFNELLRRVKEVSQNRDRARWRVYHLLA
ncbi:uncharacterized protein LOC133521952 [Cydia pomonella]|uniref:uncharacterized protein LOC133521952 n=1 Tax=Cydia pomonella TaxID=82600 RepID=UPI002ADE0445|nr:uncharacterized protein LOC133521952 [Cydia pomonella]